MPFVPPFYRLCSVACRDKSSGRILRAGWAVKISEREASCQCGIGTIKVGQSRSHVLAILGMLDVFKMIIVCIRIAVYGKHLRFSVP